MHTLALSLFHISVGEAYTEINCLFTNVTGPLSDSNWSVVLPTDQVPCMPWVFLGMCLLSPQCCIAPSHSPGFFCKENPAAPHSSGNQRPRAKSCVAPARSPAPSHPADGERGHSCDSQQHPQVLVTELLGRAAPRCVLFSAL